MPALTRFQKRAAFEHLANTFLELNNAEKAGFNAMRIGSLFPFLYLNDNTLNNIQVDYDGDGRFHPLEFSTRYRILHFFAYLAWLDHNNKRPTDEEWFDLDLEDCQNFLCSGKMRLFRGKSLNEMHTVLEPVQEFDDSIQRDSPVPKHENFWDSYWRNVENTVDEVHDPETTRSSPVNDEIMITAGDENQVVSDFSSDLTHSAHKNDLAFTTLSSDFFEQEDVLQDQSDLLPAVLFHDDLGASTSHNTTPLSFGSSVFTHSVSKENNAAVISFDDCEVDKAYDGSTGSNESFIMPTKFPSPCGKKTFVTDDYLSANQLPMISPPPPWPPPDLHYFSSSKKTFDSHLESDSDDDNDETTYPLDFVQETPAAFALANDWYHDVWSLALDGDTCEEEIIFGDESTFPSNNTTTIIPSTVGTTYKQD